MTKNFFITIILSLILVSSCTHKKVKEPLVDDYSSDMLKVYEKLIKAIKWRDYDTILSCYTPDANFIYNELLEVDDKRFSYFGTNKNIVGSQNIVKQYEYLFTKKLLNNIEFEVQKVNKQELSILFINAWDYTDYGVSEKIIFAKNDNDFYIKEHITAKVDLNERR